ncbi:MAG: hydratase, partial [Lachnospiraceae bacterium]|nr:hydratase [Lachnospiraceae bacterium]
MITLLKNGAYVVNGEVIEDTADGKQKVAAMLGSVPAADEAKKATLSYGILEAHNTSGSMDKLKIKFDKLTSHDITFVGIIQTARASGLTEFPVPYVLTNCHNSLCAVGGTINEDDHMFGLSCAKRYGG